jgi:uncharacterized protein (DUF488 family)
MKIFTIGFTQTSAESFFTRLRNARVRKVIDVRLSNTSQLAGFAKKDDLRYFLDALAGIEYEHAPELAPTPELFDSFKKRRGAWEEFEPAFRELMIQRRVEKSISRTTLDGACLLCSEAEARHCHRRLVAEYLRERWGDVEIVHL